MSYADIMNKLKVSKKRAERFEKSIAKETEVQHSLLKELGADISAVTGESITIGKVSVPANKPMNPNYNRHEVANRVVELRDIQKMSFTTIAATLNAEGYKPRSAEMFSQATVYQLYKTAGSKVITASA
jgi:hypothetical protein